MVTQLTTLMRADVHCFKLNFQGNSALLQEPLSFLEVREGKGNTSPTSFLQTLGLAHCVCGSGNSIDGSPISLPLDDEIKFNTEALPYTYGWRWIPSAWTLSRCYVRSCAPNGFVYIYSRWLCKTKFLFSFMVRLRTTTKLWAPGKELDGQHSESRLTLPCGRFCPDHDANL